MFQKVSTGIEVSTFSRRKKKSETKLTIISIKYYWLFDRWVETSPATNFNGRIKCNHRFYRQKRRWKVNLWRSQSSFETSRRKGILQQYHSAIVWINFVINSTVIVQNFRRKKKEGSTKNQKRTHQINLQQIHLEKKKI